MSVAIHVYLRKIFAENQVKKVRLVIDNAKRPTDSLLEKCSKSRRLVEESNSACSNSTCQSKKVMEDHSSSTPLLCNKQLDLASEDLYQPSSKDENSSLSTS